MIVFFFKASTDSLKSSVFLLTNSTTMSLNESKMDDLGDKIYDQAVQDEIDKEKSKKPKKEEEVEKIIKKGKNK